MPHKEAALACSDEVDPIARVSFERTIGELTVCICISCIVLSLIFIFQYIGAVNTLIKRPSDEKLIGYNTDYTGAISAIETTLQGI